MDVEPAISDGDAAVAWMTLSLDLAEAASTARRIAMELYAHRAITKTGLPPTRER